MAQTSKFRGIENAKVVERLPWLNPGRYLLEVESIKVLATRNKGDAFIAEFKILESDGESANPKGTSASYFVPLSTDTAFSNIKQFVAALANEKHSQVSQQMVDNLVVEDGPNANPAKGERVRAEAFMTKTKKGSDFTAIRFAPATESAAKPAKKAA